MLCGSYGDSYSPSALGSVSHRTDPAVDAIAFTQPSALVHTDTRQRNLQGLQGEGRGHVPRQAAIMDEASELRIRSKTPLELAPPPGLSGCECCRGNEELWRMRMAGLSSDDRPPE